MKPPLLSVVIPVKYNSGTLESTLNTVLSQEYSPLQIVVSNNSNQKEVYGLVQKINDDRITYISTENDLNFSDDWEFALSGADGEFVTFLGDDDGILPNALEYGMQMLLENNVDAFTWKKLNYNWPNHVLSTERNVIEGTSSQEVRSINAQKALKLLAKFKFGYNKLPCIYNSIVKREHIENIKSISSSKKFFSGVIPDVYSSIVLSTQIDRYLYASFPLTLNGGSVKSSGVMQGLKKQNEKQRAIISDVLNSGERYHKDIGEFSSSIASIVLGEYLLAKSIINDYDWEKPSWVSYIMYLTYESKTARNPEKIIAAAKYTAKLKNIPWIFPSDVNTKKDNNKKVSSRFDGRILLPENFVGDVEEAAELFYDLIPNHKDVIKKRTVDLLREWLSFSVMTVLKMYRNFKLS